MQSQLCNVFYVPSACLVTESSSCTEFSAEPLSSNVCSNGHTRIGDVVLGCADLTEEDVRPLKSKMADNLFQQVPVGVGGHGNVK